MTQPLHPSEFITLTNLNNPIHISVDNMVPGTVVRLRKSVFVLVDVSKGPHQWLAARTGHYLTHEQLATLMRKDTTNLPVVLFDPLGADTNEKENNND
jgi:hypothetical protein